MPKVIIVVDLYRIPANWEVIENIEEKYSIPIIEDAANVIGFFYNGKFCSVFGALSTYSFFNCNKMIFTSGG